MNFSYTKKWIRYQNMAFGLYYIYHRFKYKKLFGKIKISSEFLCWTWYRRIFVANGQHYNSFNNQKQETRNAKIWKLLNSLEDELGL